jgi:hypothetical protein
VSVFPDPLLLAPAADDEVVTKSCRFDGGTDTYMRRDIGVSGTSSTKMTMSWWMKVSGDTITTAPLFNAALTAYVDSGTTPNNNTWAHIVMTNGRIIYGSWSGSSTGPYWQKEANALFRDPASWYHCVLSVTNASGATDAQLWINGVEDDFDRTNTVPSGGDTALPWGASNTSLQIHRYGQSSSSYYWGVMLADVHCLIGTGPADFSSYTNPAYAFAEEDANGQWVPKTPTGLSYGTEGFHLEFLKDGTSQDSDGIGADTANTNHFALTGLAASDQMNDRPTNNYATLNPLSSVVNSGYRSLTEGNLSYNTTGSGFWTDVSGTMGIPDSGQWYFEVDIVVLPTATTQNYFIGLVKNTATDMGGSHSSPARTDTMGLYCAANVAYKSKDATNTSTNGGSIATAGQVYMVAVDMDARKFWLGLEGSWFDSGDPAEGTNPAYSSIGTDWNIMLSLYAYTTPFGVLRLNTGADPTFAGDDPVATPATSEFAYTPPTGYSALSTANLPTPTIADGTEHFDTLLYTGDSGESSAYDITGLKFQPDIVWLKARTYAGSHRLVDSVRAGLGTDTGGTMFPDSASGEGAASYADSGYIGAFLSGSAGSPTGGITLTPGSINFTNVNSDGITYAAWNWLAGTGFDPAGGSATTDGSKNATAGFSIAKWTGNSTDYDSTSHRTLAHGLSAAPNFAILKSRASQNWIVYHKSLTAGKFLVLNETYGSSDHGGNLIVDAGWDATNFKVGNDGYSSGYNLNVNSTDYIGYFFSEVAGYSKFGSYGPSDYPFVWLGFRPSFLMLYNHDGSYNWAIHDSARDTYNYTIKRLYPDSSSVENGSELETTYGIDFLSNGFKIKASHSTTSDGYSPFIYAAFAEQPFKYAAAR